MGYSLVIKNPSDSPVKNGRGKTAKGLIRVPFSQRVANEVSGVFKRFLYPALEDFVSKCQAVGD